MKMTVYCSYGVLCHEKRPVYSIHVPAGEIHDKEEINIPDEIILGKNEFDEPILLLDGMKYLLSEALTNAGDKPVIRWHNGQTYKTISLA